MGKRERLTQWLRRASNEQNLTSGSSNQPSDITTSTSPSSFGLLDSYNANTQLRNHVLERAINEFLATLPDAEKDTFQSASEKMTELDILNQVHEYDENHRVNSALRPHAECLGRFFAIFSRFLQGTATGVQANPDVAAIAVGLIRIVTTVALGFVGFFDRLSEMINRVSDYLGPISTYVRSTDVSKLLEDCLASTYIVLFKFWRSARLVFVDAQGETRKWTSWRVFWRVQWVPFEEEFQKTETELKHNLDVLNHAAHAVTLETSLQMRRENHDLRDKGLAREKELFLTWLSDYPFEDVHQSLYAKKHPGTGEWLMRHPEFEKWFRNDNSSVLWCYGKPGVGKSILASNVIEHITAQCALDTGISIAFIYYKHEASKMQSPTSIFAALIKQICRRPGTIPEGLLHVKQDAYPPSHLANVDSFFRVIEHFNIKELFLVIDALDECPKGQRPEIIKNLREITSHSALRVKLLATSRPATDIENAFTLLEASQIKIEAEDVEQDISKYVMEETTRLIVGEDGRQLYLSDETLKDEIVARLASEADGMFLWVNLQLLHLCEESESRNDKLIEDALKTLPNGLEATYDRSFHQIYQQSQYRRTLASLILKWVMYAERPLTLQELSEALTFEDDQYKEQKLNSNFITAVCGNLIETKPAYFDETIYVARLIHYSVKEFILENSDLDSQGRSLIKLHDEKLMESSLAILCVEYLLMNLTGTKSCKLPTNVRRRILSYPFLWYAAKSFDLHAAKGIRSQALIDCCDKMLRQPNEFLSLILQIRSIRNLSTQGNLQMNSEDVRVYEETGDPILVIFSSELFGMKVFDRHWKSETLQLSSELLPLACAAGVKDAVHHVLTTASVSVNSRSQEGTTGLYYAAKAGHEEIVRQLIDHQAVVDCPGGTYGYPLQAAAAKGHFAVARILIAAGADVDLVGGAHSTALQAACQKPDATIVQLLLDVGADVNIRGGVYGSALQAACYLENRKIVRMLLDAGADVNAPGGYYGSAVMATMDYEIRQMLIKAGAEGDFELKSHGTSPDDAAFFGNEAHLRMYADVGADMHLQRPINSTPFDPAAIRDDIDDLGERIIPNTDANIGTKQHLGNVRALLFATLCEDVDLVKRLLDGGAHADSQPGASVSPLRAALRHRNPKILRLLLERGADASKVTGAVLEDILKGLSKNVNSDYFTLGRCLMLEGKLKDFDRCCGLHTAICDGCDKTLLGEGFACASCVIIDLCPQCMQLYGQGEELGQCKDHEFVEIHYRTEGLLGSAVLDEETLEWLRKLSVRYSQDSHRTADGLAGQLRNGERWP